jgi:transposase
MKTNTTSKTKEPAPKTTAQPCVPEVTIGVDMGDRSHAICALDAAGEIIDERKITNTRESLRRLSKKHPGARIIIEVGSHSPWTSRLLQGLGHEVIVANPRKLRAIYQNDRKSDELDARMLAKIGRLDPSLLYPIAHQGEEAQRDLLGVKLRNSLVRQRVDAISSVRFTLKSLGHRLPPSNTNGFAKCARNGLEVIGQPELLETIEPSLQVIELLTEKIKEFDKKIEVLCEKKYPETGLLRQIAGVGPITALTYRLVVDSPERFESSRDVGAYFGLVPKRDQSGELDKELRISKAGNKYMRTLLVGAAQYILGPFGPDSDLRRRGLILAERGGRGAKKKAVVATARKLSVVMHRLWATRGEYLPTRGESKPA